MSRLLPWILVTAVWAAIYLPALGSFEIKGEEGRRILPAIAMLDSGNYLVPQIGADTYFSKPPLVNWLVAGSFKVFGIRNEWTARAPSVLAVLAVALVFVTVGGASLGRAGGLIAGLVWLTTIGIIEKGRLIEIEAVYVSLCAIAIICWLSWWLTKRSPWLTWIVPWIFLGLAWLAKGPVHLIFFYAVVIFVLWQTRNLKALLHPAHLIGLLIMTGMFAAWAVPFLQSSGQSRGLTKWSGQFTGRVSPEGYSARPVFSTLFRTIGQLLPWLLFAGFVRFRRFNNTRDREIARALAWSVAVPALAIALLPISAARYSLPVVAPFSWLIALSLTRDGLGPLGRLSSSAKWNRAGLTVVALAAIAAAIAFPTMAFWPGRPSKVRTVAQQINAAVPATETLYAVDPGYQPFLFYVRARVKYLDELSELPSPAHYFLVRRAQQEQALASGGPSARRPDLLARIIDYRNETVLLFRRDRQP
ncbi:MAG: ArnT family glycosyltransferase [Chthoniobacterales bacterium]